ncbi:ubiquitin carboxyl-terminal hydrolase 10-A-like [Babylonia areolata]|uniref:ubiquitin carboxyl-terminal hydrolase 10-A-like n=1 Tax=Babylonia areolata TaxID=304850 RepID=UPI003FD692F0
MSQLGRKMEFAFIDIAGTHGEGREALLKLIKKIGCTYYESGVRTLNCQPNGQEHDTKPKTDDICSEKHSSNSPSEHHSEKAQKTLNANGPLEDLSEKAQKPLNVHAPVFMPKAQGINSFPKMDARPPKPAAMNFASLFKSNGNGNTQSQGQRAEDFSANTQKAKRPTEKDGEKLRVALAVQSFLSRQVDSCVKLPQPKGMKNSGTLCYLLCVLQSMFGIQEFVSFMTTLSRSLEGHNLDVLEEQAPFCGGIVRLWRDYIRRPSEEQPFLDDVYIVRHLPKLNNNAIKADRQGDATEFFHAFVTRVQDELKLFKDKQQVTNGPIDYFAENGQEEEKEEGGWQQVKVGRRAGRRQLHVDRNCPLQKIFGGVMTHVKLNASGKVLSNSKPEPFICLTVVVMDDSVRTVHDALQKFFAAEVITTDPQTEYRKTVLCELPRTLVVTFENICVDENSRLRKVTKQIVLEETITLQPDWLSASLNTKVTKEKLSYSLMSGFFHKGESYSAGHYVAFTKRLGTEEWNIISDDKLTSMSTKEIMNYQNSPFHGTTVPHGLLFRLHSGS